MSKVLKRTEKLPPFGTFDWVRNTIEKLAADKGLSMSQLLHQICVDWLTEKGYAPAQAPASKTK